MKSKRGSLSIQMIIVAALGLFVLIVLVIVLSGKTNWTTKTIATCETNNGQCSATCEPPNGKVLPYICYTEQNGKQVKDKTKKCCGYGG